MDTNDPLSALLNHAKSAVEDLERAAPWHQLSSKAELDAIKRDIERLTRIVEALEARIAKLEAKR